VARNFGHKPLQVAFDVANEGNVSSDGFAFHVDFDGIFTVAHPVNDAAHWVSVLVWNVDLLAGSDIHEDDLPVIGMAKHQDSRHRPKREGGLGHVMG
jgi:hypothetical protein